MWLIAAGEFDWYLVLNGRGSRSQQLGSSADRCALPLCLKIGSDRKCKVLVGNDEKDPSEQASGEEAEYEKELLVESVSNADKLDARAAVK